MGEIHFWCVYNNNNNKYNQSKSRLKFSGWRGRKWRDTMRTTTIMVDGWKTTTISVPKLQWCTRYSTRVFLMRIVRIHHTRARRRSLAVASGDRKLASSPTPTHLQTHPHWGITYITYYIYVRTAAAARVLSGAVTSFVRLDAFSVLSVFKAACTRL